MIAEYVIQEDIAPRWNADNPAFRSTTWKCLARVTG